MAYEHYDWDDESQITGKRLNNIEDGIEEYSSCPRTVAYTDTAQSVGTGYKAIEYEHNVQTCSAITHSETIDSSKFTATESGSYLVVVTSYNAIASAYFTIRKNNTDYLRFSAYQTCNQIMGIIALSTADYIEIVFIGSSGTLTTSTISIIKL